MSTVIHRPSIFSLRLTIGAGRSDTLIMHPYRMISAHIAWKGLIVKILVCIPILFTYSELYSQEREWALDVIERQEKEKQRVEDSLITHFKNNWDVSLSYGRWYFHNSSRSTTDELFFLSQSMGLWNLSLGRYFTESLRVNLAAGVQIEKFEPDPINFNSVLSGSNIELEGGGIFFLPLSAGLDYFFLKERFRPYLGMGLGNVVARSKFVTVSGSLSTAVDQDEYEVKGNTPFYTLTSGFIYRTGKYVQMGANIEYANSRSFKEKVGGYSRYHGLIVAANISFIF
jgi:hypothetical protein